MSDPEDSAEPLQKLPAGMPRRFAEYKPVTSGIAGPPPTNVGGYDELLNYFREQDHALPRKADSLATLDQAINGKGEDGLPAELARPIGIFYGDVLTHAVPGAHWEVVEEGYPLVRVTRNVAVDVVRIAPRRLTTRSPQSNKTMPTSSNWSGGSRRRKRSIDSKISPQQPLVRIQQDLRRDNRPRFGSWPAKP